MKLVSLFCIVTRKQREGKLPHSGETAGFEPQECNGPDPAYQGSRLKKRGFTQELLTGTLPPNSINLPARSTTTGYQGEELFFGVLLLSKKGRRSN